MVPPCILQLHGAGLCCNQASEAFGHLDMDGDNWVQLNYDRFMGTVLMSLIYNSTQEKESVGRNEMIVVIYCIDYPALLNNAMVVVTHILLSKFDKVYFLLYRRISA